MPKMWPKAWVTPFTKQCFVTAGASLNFLGHGLDIGYVIVLIAELKASRNMRSDDAVISWIASISTVAVIFGALTVSPVVRKYGRRYANFISALMMTLAWFGLALSDGLIILFILRFIQGFSMGFTGYVGAILIGEYTSPRLRGAFLSTITLTIVIGIFLSHTLGAFLSRKLCALVCAMIGVIDVIVIYFSPETPSFLAFQHRYDECRKVFRWLRGFEEEDELNALVQRHLTNEENENKRRTEKYSFRAKISSVIGIVKKKEFYKTIALLMSIDSWSVWFGMVVLDTYALDIFNIVIGNDVNFAAMIVFLGIQRMITNALGIIVFRHMNRRKIFKITTFLMVLCLVTTGLYVYGKAHKLLPFDHPSIGICLIHLQSFTNAVGGMPFPNVILGEITPLQYREICGMLYLIFCSVSMFIMTKLAPLIFHTIGLHSLYFIFCGVILLSTVLPWILLPETKDRTLQEIEDMMFRDNSRNDAKDAVALHFISLLDRDVKDVK